MGKDLSESNPETSEKLTGLKVSKPKKVAAGMEAVKYSLQHIADEVGLIKGLEVLNQLNQKGGIDCPGCAWPDPDDDRSKLGEYCENGAKAIAEEATKKKLLPSFFAKNSVADLSQLSDYQIGKKGRIAQPMYLASGDSHYQEISWIDAFLKIGKQLNQLQNPNEAIFYTSGRTSNEAAFLYQLFVREFGTNNLPDCSNMCHESSGAALGETLGIGKGSVKLEDFYEAEVIIVMGQNPGTNHPRMLSALEIAKKNGAKIVSINPLIETGLLSFNNPQKLGSVFGKSTKLSEQYLQVRINGDLPLLQSINYFLLAEENKKPGSVFDLDFIKNKTEGAKEYLKHLQNLEVDKLISASGISEAEIHKLVKLIKNKSKIIVCWAMGLTQHKNSVDTIKEIVNLLLLKGSIGKPGAGTCPVRGHSNVQGDRTMGIYEKPPEVLLKNIKANFKFDPPTAHGYDTVNAIKAMYQKKAKVFFAMGGNFLSASPDTLYTAKALQNCELTVHVSTKLNRSHLIHGKEAIILPCLARTDKDLTGDHEQFVSVENSMGVVHSSQGILEPISDKLKSEVEIVCQLAKATIKKSKVEWDKYLSNYDHVREDIEACIDGFNDYNKKVRQPAGFYLPNCARENEFNSKSKRAIFSISDYHGIELNKDEFIMMTIRSHDQFNTTIYGLDDRYRGIKNERRVIMMNKEDIKNKKLKKGDIVDLYNYHDNHERVARTFIVVEYNIPKQCVATYFPEANVLVPINSTADKSNTPTSKSVIIKIKKAN